MTVRWAEAADHDALGALMTRAILAEPSPYSEAHRTAWAGGRPRSGPAWTARLAGHAVALIDGPDGPRGMMSVDAGGYVDLAFVAPEARGTGAFRRLHDAVLARARAEGLVRLTTHASLAARGPFEAAGWAVEAPETVEIGGLAFARFAMARGV
ncbi:GNAT family N-acetyltransferase [Jannaschia sp. Os4]|uniref:GNAT family N-acetyltransferase n=1 Tax=Jannaschia sp. Os4 TaxID=2807617 RepID=UPI00193997FE|nr:GNAT family N-acetyltransferase [Jannaschia sp. Os4]MBM2575052.1 GNAT family N-acetyltransferase [Jannaschia sp. Os4]